jgi:REP element-mobilizing transposase RayT
MPRQLRIEYPGAIYHIMNRGDRREPIFKDDHDRHRFLETLGECCGKTSWQVHAYCLMANHFHLVVETPLPNLVAGMKWFLGTYTSRFNRKHRLFGHLFSGRYKSLLVDGSGNGYLKTACDYVHLNPVRAQLIDAEQLLQTFPWSSYPEYLKPPAKRPQWLRVDRLLGENGIFKDSSAGREQFALRMEQRRTSEKAMHWKPLRRGWCLGDDAFRDELLEQVSRKSTEQHGGPERIEAVEQKAERIVREELRKLGWTARELRKARKGASEKVAIALRLRRETTISLKWMAGRLQMGSWTHAANRIYETQHPAQKV